LAWSKIFGLAQKILGPVEGQDISKFHFSAGTKFFGVALNAIQFLILHKIFGLAQNILGLVQGQGICNF
jgi:hypothetical protein